MGWGGAQAGVLCSITASTKNPSASPVFTTSMMAAICSGVSVTPKRTMAERMALMKAMMLALSTLIKSPGFTGHLRC